MRSVLLLAAASVPSAAAIAWNTYDLGFHGLYPTRHFESVDYEIPDTKITKWDPSCEYGSLFLTPRGPWVAGNARGPMILDPKGDLIWMNNDEFQQALNFDVQTYKGEEYLTFWTKHIKTKSKKDKKKDKKSKKDKKEKKEKEIGDQPEDHDENEPSGESEVDEAKKDKKKDKPRKQKIPKKSYVMVSDTAFSTSPSPVRVPLLSALSAAQLGVRGRTPGGTRRQAHESRLARVPHHRPRYSPDHHLPQAPSRLHGAKPR
jgi:hypothetical protein